MGENNQNSIKNRIVDFYNDPDFQKLKAYYGKTTLFNVLKIERNENRHSAFLAWLLDKNGSHGLGEEPLKRFMRLLAKTDEKYTEPFLVGNYQIENTNVVTELPVKADGHSKTGRIDIYIDFDYKLLLGTEEERNKMQHVHVIVENKVYTNEHDDQTKLYIDWARQEYKGKHNQTIIGVFLAPEKPNKCAGDDDEKEGCFKYVKITYQEILKYVIEPLLFMGMPQEAQTFITDYVINLGQPVNDSDENNTKGNSQDTILAISNENEQKFFELYRRNKDLLDAALYAKCQARNEKQLQMVFPDCEKFKQYKEMFKMLESFWDSNNMLLRMILDTTLRNEDDADDKSAAINILLRLNGSNRDNTKYLVYTKDGVLMNESEKKPAPKSLASYYIFKAWMHDHKDATLSEIRNAFSVKKCASHYNETYQYLFYRKVDMDLALQRDKTEKTYYIASLDEDNDTTKRGKKYLTWDFFTDGKHCLEIQDEKVLSVKMWLKDEFDFLVDYAKNEFGILAKEQ